MENLHLYSIFQSLVHYLNLPLIKLKIPFIFQLISPNAVTELNFKLVFTYYYRIETREYLAVVISKLNECF